MVNSRAKIQTQAGLLPPLQLLVTTDAAFRFTSDLLIPRSTTSSPQKSLHLNMSPPPMLIIPRERALPPPTPTVPPHPLPLTNLRVGQQHAGLTATLLLPALQCPRGGRYRLLESKDHLFPSDLSPQFSGTQLNIVIPGQLVAVREELIPGHPRTQKSMDAQVPYIKWCRIFI